MARVSPTKALIVDANIWIDLEAGGIAHEVFKLDFRWHCPDFVISEINDSHFVSRLLSNGLKVIRSSGKEIREIQELNSKHLNLGLNDTVALYHAKGRACPLITGDKALGLVAQEYSVTVRGTLWIMDELISHGVLKGKKAKAALQKMVKKKRRLPSGEVERRLRHWSS